MTEDWTEIKIDARNKQKLHLRPIQRIVEESKKHQSEIQFEAGGEAVDPKNMLDLIVFAGGFVSSDSEELVVKAKGDDAEQALEGLGGLMTEIFMEEAA